MPGFRDRPSRQLLRLATAAVAAALISIALVLPALATTGASWLDHPSVTPRSGTTATLITFRVTYRSVLPEAPSDVHVTVGETSIPMVASGSRWAFGVTYTAKSNLPEGTFAVVFVAHDSLGNEAQASGGTVSVGPASPPADPGTSAPPSGPSPEPSLPHGGSTGGSSTHTNGGAGGGEAGGAAGSSPPDSGAGTPGPTDPPGDVAGPSTGGDATTGAGGASGKGTGENEAGPGARPSLPGSSDASAGDPDTAAGGGRADVAATRIGRSAGTAGGVASGGGSKSALTSFDRGMAALGLGAVGPLPTIPAVVMSSTAVGTWMGFLIFNRRRRDEEEAEPDDTLRARAATGIAFAAGTAPGDQDDPEAHLPRWLRPSLREARRIDPARTPAAVIQPMSFATTGASGGAAGLDRRFVRYAVAALLAEPDELRGDRISEVAAGDEVQVEGRSGAYFQVACPDGRRGWIHRTALSEIPELVSHPWKAPANDPAMDGENALAALLAARGLQRTAS